MRQCWDAQYGASQCEMGRFEIDVSRTQIVDRPVSNSIESVGLFVMLQYVRLVSHWTRYALRVASAHLRVSPCCVDLASSRDFTLTPRHSSRQVSKSTLLSAARAALHKIRLKSVLAAFAASLLTSRILPVSIQSMT